MASSWAEISAARNWAQYFLHTEKSFLFSLNHSEELTVSFSNLAARTVLFSSKINHPAACSERAYGKEEATHCIVHGSHFQMWSNHSKMAFLPAARQSPERLVGNEPKSYNNDTKQTTLMQTIWPKVTWQPPTFLLSSPVDTEPLKGVCKSIFKTLPVIYSNSRWQFHSPMISRLPHCGFQVFFSKTTMSDRNVLSAPPGQRSAFLFVKTLMRTSLTGTCDPCFPLLVTHI